MPETTHGHQPGRPQSTSQLKEAGLTHFYPLGMRQGGAEEEGCGWGGLAVSHVSLYKLDTPWVPA